MPTADTADEETPSEWIQNQAVPISIAPTNDDFSDLEPFGEAIGSARIVLLGEQSHGDGSVFLAKARLIEYMHRELGFDVLAFESGLYDLHKVWQLIEAGENAATAMPKGVFRIWMGSAQVAPLVEYVEEAARTALPLQLAGFDCQFTGSASQDHLVDDLADFLNNAGSDLPETSDWDTFTATLQGLIDGDWWEAKPAEAEKTALEEFVDTIHDAVVQLPENDDTRFWTQMLESIQEQVRFNWEFVLGEWDTEIVSIRDMQMGDNLLWLLEEGFPGRKIVVWAATLHAVRRLDQIDMRSTTASYEGYTSMGHVVWQGIGNDSYVVGFTAGGGEAGTWWTEPRQLDAPEPGSLEEFFMDAGFDNAFLDFRSIPEGGEWLNGALLSRPLGYGYMIATWPRHMDAMIFMRSMTPSTPLSN